MNIKSALKEWDGKSAADIKAIYDIYQTELNFVNDIVELSFICDYENAATWLLKAWLEDGNQLKQSQIKT